jgi:hypothetical protein
MGSVERRLRRLEAQAPAAPGEEEIRAEACCRMSTEDLTVLAETLRRLEAVAPDTDDLEEAWACLSEGERTAFEAAYGRYQEAVREARAGR